jgi:hypothetical protein
LAFPTLAFPTFAFHEIGCHAAVDDTTGLLRLNVYLSKGRDFVAIWFGLSETFMAAGRFAPQNNRPLFRGYIDSQDTATVVLKALRLKGYGTPQVLRGAPHAIRCELLS